MQWLLVLDLATDGAALAFTSITLLLAYRTATLPIRDDSFDDDLSRQSDCGSYAILAGVMAVGLVLITHMAF